MSDPDYSVVTERAGRAQQVCEALIALLDAADRDEVFNEKIRARRVYPVLGDLGQVGEWVDVVIASPMTKRVRNSNGTYGRYVVVDIVVRAHLAADAAEDMATMDSRDYLLEQIENYLASPDNHDLTLPNDKLAQYVELTDTRADGDIRNDLGVLWDIDMLETHRQITGLVRVAYWVDEDY
jgi:hypothetical protein